MGELRSPRGWVKGFISLPAHSPHPLWPSPPCGCCCGWAVAVAESKGYIPLPAHSPHPLWPSPHCGRGCGWAVAVAAVRWAITAGFPRRSGCRHSALQSLRLWVARWAITAGNARDAGTQPPKV